MTKDLTLPLKLAFLADETQDSQSFLQYLLKESKSVPMEEADVVVVLGGDGFLLKILHSGAHLNKPVYGINCGSVGFLMNAIQAGNLSAKIQAVRSVTLFPLYMTAYDVDGRHFEAYTINEVYLYRQTYQASKLRVFIDEVERLKEIMCDGIILATPAGSTAYNFSAHGPILPLESNLLALTPISSFRPRHWRGALLPSTSKVRVEVLESDKRPVAVVAGSSEFPNIKTVEVSQSMAHSYTLLYDRDHALEERIIREQFTV
jgi:NAD+ kinase